MCWDGGDSGGCEAGWGWAVGDIDLGRAWHRHLLIFWFFSEMHF